MCVLVGGCIGGLFLLVLSSLVMLKFSSFILFLVVIRMLEGLRLWCMIRLVCVWLIIVYICSISCRWCFSGNCRCW